MVFLSAVRDTLDSVCPSTTSNNLGIATPVALWPFWEAVPREYTRLIEPSYGTLSAEFF